MSLRQLDLTTALRPSLQPDETLLFVQDAVGLYSGRVKLPQYQNGHAYLTSHRACYVDNDQPRSKAVAINLKDVDRCEAHGGFLKSSPKVTLIPKVLKPLTQRTAADGGGSSTPRLSSSPLSRSFTPPPQAQLSNATWICPICSFSNPVPSTFDAATANDNTPLSPCQACGIKPPLIHVTKAAIASLSNRSTGSVLQSDLPKFQCPRCTFQNHPSLLSCEICGASLVSSPSVSSPQLDSTSPSRTASPALGLQQSANQAVPETNEGIRFSFRAGGDKIFNERLKGALIQRKWLLQSAPPTPRPDSMESGRSTPNSPIQRGFGIAGLERRGLELRKNNELVIGNAFEDLEALMASAKDIIALAETFARSSASSNTESGTSPGQDPAALLSQLNLTTTKDMLSNSSSSTARSLYLSELSRSLAEYLTDDTKGILRSEGGIISLVDLWAVFNRARGGVELVSPTDFAAAAELFDKLQLPIRLRRFKSNLLVVQERSRTDAKTVAALLSRMRALRHLPPERSVPWDWTRWGRGVTAQEVAEMFGWSVGVAIEELEMAEEMGALCREARIEGVWFWENFLITEKLG